MEIFQLKQGDLVYPSAWKKFLGDCHPEIITTMGNLDILTQKKLAFFCSIKCPGHLILKTYDLAQHLKEAGVTVIGGFHSPIERECLRILLRGPQPVIVCPARSLKGMRLQAEYKDPIKKGQLLLLSPFKESKNRNTVEAANERNRFVAALADTILVAHASPNSKTERFCHEVLSWGKPLYTLESDANINLIRLGMKPIGLNNIGDLV